MTAVGSCLPLQKSLHTSDSQNQRERDTARTSQKASRNEDEGRFFTLRKRSKRLACGDSNASDYKMG